jgi:small Trp-rich protein
MKTTTALTLLFIGLKLANFIDWSWWWVMSPFALTCILSFIFGMVLGYNKKRDKKVTQDYIKELKEKA